MEILLSQVRSRLRVIAVGLCVGAVCLLGAARFDVMNVVFAAGRSQPVHTLAAQGTAPDTVVVFGPKQFVTAKNATQLNFVESFSVPTGTTSPTNPTWHPHTTLYTVRLRRVGGSLTTANVTVNGKQIASVTDFASATYIERIVLLNQAANNSNTVSLSLKGAAGAGLIVTVAGTPFSHYAIFGPKTYTKTSATPTRFSETFALPVGATPPYHIAALASASGTKATVTLNGVIVIKDADFTNTTLVVREVNPVNGSNSLKVDVRGNTGTNVYVLVTATDKSAPVLTITSPEPNLATSATTIAVTGTSTDRDPTEVTVNGVLATMSGPGNTQFSATVPLNEGTNTLAIKATDLAGNHTDSTRTVTRDTQAPTLALTTPTDNSYSNQAATTVSGTSSGASAVTVNGVSFPVGQDGTFSGSYQLAPGANFITVVATDVVGNSVSATHKVTLDTDAPVITVASPAEGSQHTTQPVVVSGTVRDATSADRTSVTVNGAAVSPGAFTDPTTFNFSTEIALAAGANAISVIATDGAGNTATATRSVTRTVETPPGDGLPETLPSDPLVHAPPVQASVATTPFEAGEFLYTGANPLQAGVAAGTIEPRRGAVLRGRVLSRDGAPIAGVEITVLDHPELGRTETRASGQYDLAVNGGGNLLLRYAKDGLLPILRRADVPWQDYMVLQDVFLLGLDAQVTTVDLTGGTPVMQVARGSAQTDADGTRQATVMFPAGATATMVLPDGTTQPLGTLHVRATEYTVGENGPRMMPAPLPATSAYTYAVELTVDEALAASATSVQFSQAVPFYVENFLGLPVGVRVPAGVLDHQRGVWVPDENGLVIRILAKTGALADLDTNGDGTADDQAMLLALGISDDERSRLATLYQTGQTLWRIPRMHFSTEDYNLPPAPFKPPKGKAPKVKPKLKTPHAKTVCVTPARSTIECQTQVLGERIGLVGTPFALHYRSDRSPLRPMANTIEIPLTDSTIPDGLRQVMLTVAVAGRQFVDSLPPAPNLKRTFVWDGLDAYGRRVQGGQTATVTIGYGYDQFYAVPPDVARNFGLVCRGDPELPDIEASVACLLTDSINSRARKVGFVNQVWQSKIGNFSPEAAGLGGWTLDVHDAYDPMAHELYTGDGRRRRADAVGAAITTKAGRGTRGSDGDGGPAVDARLSDPMAVAVGPDGVLYIADKGNRRVRSVGSDGVIQTVASGIFNVGPMVVDPAGRVYVISGGQVVYRFMPGSGGLEIIAGTPPDTSGSGETRNRDDERSVGAIASFASSVIAPGPSDFEGFSYAQDVVAVAHNIPARAASSRLMASGVPAVDARFVGLTGMALGPDGTLYLTDIETGHVWRVGVDGIATIFAGTGSVASGADAEGVLAAAANFHGLWGVAAAANGNVYIADGIRVRKIGPDGIVITVAGNLDDRTGNDGDLGTDQLLAMTTGVAVARDGGLYIATIGDRIYLLRPDGRMALVAGGGLQNNVPDQGKLATQVLLAVAGIALGPDGTVYVAEPGFQQVRGISPPFAGLGLPEIAVAAEDGSTLAVFNSYGLHLRTVDPLTGVVLLRFGYDSGNRLTTLTDASNNVTTILRDEFGKPTVVVGPFGQRSDLTLDTNGFLSRVTNPAGEAIGLSYHDGGLLATVTDPLGRVSRFTYANGLLVRDQDPAGGAIDLTRTEFDGGWEVSETTSLGRTTTYRVESTPSGGEVQKNTDPAGLIDQTFAADGASLHIDPDGTTTAVIKGPDPRFGLQAPILTEMNIMTPGGLFANVTGSVTVALSDPDDPASPLNQSESVVFNGRYYENNYDASARTLSSVTPEGRSTTVRFDASGRLIEEGMSGITPVQFQYDPRGRLSQISQGSRQSTYTYNSAGLLASATDPLTRSSQYFYDAADRLTRGVLTDGREVLYGYDPIGNLRSVTPPGRPAHQFQHNSIDLVTSYNPPNLGAGTWNTTYQYDLDRKLTQIARPDGQTIGFGYDAAGRPSTVTVPGGTIHYTYHSGLGNLTGVIGAYGGSLSFSYDGSLPTGVTWAGEVAGTVAATWNDNFQISGLAVNGAPAVAFTYDNDGLLTQAGALTISRTANNRLISGTTLGSVTTSQLYTAFGALDRLTASVSGSAVFDVTYTRDALGRLNGMTEAVSGTTITKAFMYDLAGRLTEVRENGTLAAVYEYDTNGNASRVTRPIGIETGTYDDQDRLLSYGTATYAFTRNGELSTKTVGPSWTNYDYDVLGNLRRVTLPDGNLIEYVLDGMNRRVGRKVNGAIVQGFLYKDPVNPVAELDGMGNVVSRFVYGTRANVPDFLIKAGVTYRIVADHVGSVRLVIDVVTGAVAQRVDYDAFGRETNNTNPGFQPFGFAGGLTDIQTGLVRFGVRDYDPRTGRWTAKDPIGFAGGAANLYSYGAGDPVNNIDPMGTCPQSVSGPSFKQCMINGGAMGAAALGLGGSLALTASLIKMKEARNLMNVSKALWDATKMFSFEEVAIRTQRAAGMIRNAASMAEFGTVLVGGTIGYGIGAMAACFYDSSYYGQ